jgi:succinate dehydrogenase membrane anchor subunit
MSFKTARRRVSGLGSARHGVDHWISQRITALALIPLSILFLYPFVRTLGADYETVRATYSNPGNAIVAILFFVALFRHLRLGVQVVIEDYVGNPRRQVQALILNTLTWRGAALVAAFAVAKIAFSA